MKTDRTGPAAHLCANFPDLAEHIERETAWMEQRQSEGHPAVGQFRAWKSNGVTLLCCDYYLNPQVLKPEEEPGVPEYHLSIDPYGNQYDDPLVPRPLADQEEE